MVEEESIDIKYLFAEIEVERYPGYMVTRIISPSFSDVVNWEYSVHESVEIRYTVGYIDRSYFDFRISEGMFVREIKIIIDDI